MWQFYADPDNVTDSIEDQGRMLAPARDQLSEANLLFASYAEGGMARGNLCGTAQRVRLRIKATFEGDNV
jgi:hypothetical protein